MTETMRKTLKGIITRRQDFFFDVMKQSVYHAMSSITELVLKSNYEDTVGQNNQEYRLKYWATRSSVRSFARTAHSFACSGLLA